MLRQEKLDFVRSAAADGMVLLKNDNGTLPINKDKKIALFGIASYQCFKLGWGSGDMLAQRIIQVNEALESAGYQIESETDSINKAWVSEHCEEYKRVNRNWAEWVFRFNEIAMPEEAIIDASQKADVAIVSIGRCSGEADDLKNTEGFFKLHADEQALIKSVSKSFKHTVLLLNTCGPLDLTSVEGCAMDSILYTSMGGEQFGNSVADIISGRVSPSAKLSTTWAKKYEDYPTTEGVDTMFVPYNEGIYVGYRYFDTFNVEPRYAFGFGLSYTSFDIEVYDFTLDGSVVSFCAKVTNTGNVAGKEVVQCYLSSPDGKLEKAYQDLAAYAKTDLLKPNEWQEMLLCFDLCDMASYDEERAAYILEAGKYIVRYGNSSRNTHVAFTINIESEIVCAKTVNRLAVQSDLLKLISKNGVAPISYSAEKEEIENAQVISMASDAVETIILNRYEDTPDELLEIKPSDRIITLEDVYNGNATVEDVVAQFTDDELATALNGVIYDGANANANVGSMAIKVRGAAGELWTSDKYKIPTHAVADGPGGIRLSIFGTPEESDTDVCHEMVAYPSGTCLANTWDSSVAHRFGECVRDDMEISDIEGWLAPGINIQRNPLNGRNFEYMSEDPVLAGITAAYVTIGVQYEDDEPTGRYVTIKHFACNNIEYERGVSDSIASERALREIYLKAFNIAIMNSGALAVMTAYNKINGQFSSTSFDLLNGILRGEWGFDGLVMTDWNPCSNSKEHSYAGNDLIMPGCHKKDILEGFKDGTVDRANAQKCVTRILELILRSSYVIKNR